MCQCGIWHHDISMTLPWVVNVSNVYLLIIDLTGSCCLTCFCDVCSCCCSHLTFEFNVLSQLITINYYQFHLAVAVLNCITVKFVVSFHRPAVKPSNCTVLSFEASCSCYFLAVLLSMVWLLLSISASSANSVLLMSC